MFENRQLDSGLTCLCSGQQNLDLNTKIATMKWKTKKNKEIYREMDITIALMPLVMKSTKQLISSWSKCS